MVERVVQERIMNDAGVLEEVDRTVVERVAVPVSHLTLDGWDGV